MHTLALIVAIIAVIIILLWLPALDFVIKRKKSRGKLTIKQYIKESLKGEF